jgi:phosphoribosyl 1,2-cyclic phosphodiesterase
MIRDNKGELTMTLCFCSFSSGSSGNCYLIKSEHTAVLVDAGISRKKIYEGLERTATPVEQLAALLITHEHSDHTKSIRTLMKKEKSLKAYAKAMTWSQLGCEVCEEQKKIFETGDTFRIGDITVKTFRVSHDAADPVGYTFFSGGKQISIVTDTGCMSEEIIAEIREADILILEANHDVDMLRVGRYPWFLKQRVLGEEGHLSNAAAGETILRLLSECSKERHVLLAHLSKENNFPEMAYQTVKNILEEADYYIGKHINLNTITRDEVSLIYEI